MIAVVWYINHLEMAGAGHLKIVLITKNIQVSHYNDYSKIANIVIVEMFNHFRILTLRIIPDKFKIFKLT